MNDRITTQDSVLNKANKSLTRFYIGKIFVYKQCFCCLNVQNVKQKNSLFHQAIALWLADINNTR